MAAAFFNQLADREKAEAISAGTEPGQRVYPEVQAAMEEIGIDLSNARPKKLTEELARDAQLLVTMGCGDKCPYVAGLRRDDCRFAIPRAFQGKRSGQYAMMCKGGCALFAAVKRWISSYMHLGTP